MSASPLTPVVVRVRPAVRGVHATLACPRCGAAFERFQPEIAGVHAGAHSCPGCASELVVTAELFDGAIAECLPALTVDEMHELTAEAARITVGWHAHPAAAGLEHRGVPLAPLAELHVMSWVTTGLLLDVSERPR